MSQRPEVPTTAADFSPVEPVEIEPAQAEAAPTRVESTASSSPKGPPPLPTPVTSASEPVDWDNVRRRLGVEPLRSPASAEQKGDQRTAALAERRKSRAKRLQGLDQTLTSFRSWLNNFETWASWSGIQIPHEDIRAKAMLREKREGHLPPEHMEWMKESLVASVQKHGKRDELTEMLVGDLEGQYEYARLRCENNGNPPPLFYGWGDLRSYNIFALPVRMARRAAYNARILVHWVKDDLALRAAFWWKSGKWVSNEEMRERRVELAQFARGQRQGMAQDIGRREPEPNEYKMLFSWDMLCTRLEAAASYDEQRAVQDEETADRWGERGFGLGRWIRQRREARQRDRQEREMWQELEKRHLTGSRPMVELEHHGEAIQFRVVGLIPEEEKVILANDDQKTTLAMDFRRFLAMVDREEFKRLKESA